LLEKEHYATFARSIKYKLKPSELDERVPLRSGQISLPDEESQAYKANREQIYINFPEYAPGARSKERQEPTSQFFSMTN